MSCVVRKVDACCRSIKRSSESAIMTKLQKLKVDKSPGPDEIHPRVLKELATVIAQPLRHIFQLSLDSGVIPEDWRSSNITAIFKKGKRSNMGNYRPVSLTSVVCKVFESIMRDHMMEYLVKK